MVARRGAFFGFVSAAGYLGRRRLVLVAVAGSFLCGLASAATLGVAGDTLGAGSVTVPRCDTDGSGGLGRATVTGYSVDAEGRVASVTIGDLDQSCAGGVLTLTLTDSAGVELGTGSVASTSATSQEVTLQGTGPDADLVAHVRAEVVGP